MRSTVTFQPEETTMSTVSRPTMGPIYRSETWQWVSFGTQVFTGIFVVGCLLWFICVTRGGTYFNKRSIADCNMHMILFFSKAVLFFFCSITSYFMFGAYFLQFGLYFTVSGFYCLGMIVGLVFIKYKFQNRCLAMIKLNRDLGTPVTEREAADLCRIKDFYERTRKSTNWQKPFFKKDQLEAWARYLAIADLTGEKQQALQQIIVEMRQGPLNWRPTYFQPTAHPIPAISNYVTPVTTSNGPPAYCP